LRARNSRWGNGKRWLACWIDPEGSEKTKAFVRRADAWTHAKAIETDRARGVYLDPAKGDQLVGEYLRLHLNTKRSLDPSSFDLYEQAVRLHVHPTFGDRRARNVSVTGILKWMQGLEATHSVSTIKRALQLLRGALDIAVEDGAIRQNPAWSKSVQLPKLRRTKLTIWRDAQVQGVLDFHSEELRAVPITGVSCGLRQGEIFALTADDIDGEWLHVSRQIKRLGGGQTVFALPKNDKIRRAPLPPSAAAALRTHAREVGTHDVTLPWETADGEPATFNLMFVWHGKHNGITSLDARLYNELVWRPALVYAGLAPEPTVDLRGRQRYGNSPRDGMHALRHFYASAMLAQGVQINELAEFLGHSDPMVTLRTYAHLMPSAHGRAVAAGSRMLSALRF
jgi:integrase